MKITKCIILAAGVSFRLRPLTEDKPKCLLEAGGIIILKRTIENILNSGISNIAIVTGYQAEKIKEFTKSTFPNLKFRFIFNPNYAKTNNAYSLLLAKRFLENRDGKIDTNLLLLDSDILFSSQLLPFFLSNKEPNKIAVRVTGNHNEEEIRVKIAENNRIISIGKEVPLNSTYGESIGIELFSLKSARILFSTLEKRIQMGAGRTEFYESTFQEMIDKGEELTAVDVSPFNAIEIDTLEDLKQAEQINFD